MGIRRRGIINIRDDDPVFGIGDDDALFDVGGFGNG